MKRPEPRKEGGAYRAVLYLRVSTNKQVGRGEDEEGYSLPTQRQALLRKAAQIEAEVVDEYVDRGESARTSDRPQFQAMMKRIATQQDVDFVIVHKIDRFARNVRDHANMLFKLQEAGAELVSVSENIDGSPQGRLQNFIMAAIAEFYSANLATEVLEKTTKKAELGGTPYMAPTGYLNVHERIDGNIVATIVPDPERARLIQYAFEAYATGEFTLRSLTEELADRGLTCRPTAKYPEKPLSLSKIAKILRSPYYIGLVNYAGEQYQGRHEPLVTPDIFQQVQDLLDGRVNAKERQRLHRHYLKGTIFCGRCGTRLGLTHATGRRGGTYLYFYCLGRQYRNGCDLPYLQVDDVEDAVQGLYASVQLTPEERAQLQSEVSSILRGEKSVADKERKRLTRQIDGLKRQRYIWADKVATGGVPDDIGRERQAGLTRQLNRANAELAALDAGGTDFEQTLDRALELASVCVKGYEQAGDHDKRLWNQTFFSQIKVLHPDHATPVLSPTFAALRPLGESSGSENERQTSRRRSESTNPGRVFLGQGSNKRRMVGAEGLEPTTCSL